MSGHAPNCKVWLIGNDERHFWRCTNLDVGHLLHIEGAPSSTMPNLGRFDLLHVSEASALRNWLNENPWASVAIASDFTNTVRMPDALFYGAPIEESLRTYRAGRLS